MSTRIHELLNLPLTATSKQLDKAYIRKLQKLQARKNDDAAEHLREAYMNFYLSPKIYNETQMDLEKNKSSEKIEIERNRETFEEDEKEPENEEKSKDNKSSIIENEDDENHTATTAVSREECQSPGKRVVADVVIEDETPEPTRIPGNPLQKELILMKGESAMQQEQQEETKPKVRVIEKPVDPRKHKYNKSSSPVVEKAEKQQEPNFSYSKRSFERDEEHPSKNIKPDINKTEGRQNFFSSFSSSSKTQASNLHSPYRSDNYNRYCANESSRASKKDEKEKEPNHSKRLLSLLDDYFDYKQNQRSNYLTNRSFSNHSQKRGTSLIELLNDAQQFQRDFFRRGVREDEERTRIEQETFARPETVPENNKTNHFESFHVSSHHHIINNGKERYMKSFSESSKNFNGKKTSK